MNRLIWIARGTGLALAVTLMTGSSAYAVDPLKLLGFSSSEKPDIEYKPRAPLVMPPDSSLPPPQEHLARSNDPRWPNDPDVQMREFTERRQEAIKRNYEERLGGPGGETSRVLTPQELDQWAANAGMRGRAKPRTGDTPIFSQPNGASPVMTPEQLRAGAASQVLPEGYVEPERAYLTDPPSGVRAAAAGAPVIKPEDAPGQRPGTSNDPTKDFKPY
ncbi:MAG: hypothetical protein H6883_01935 [Rhodobiaceae bacterium]|nr:hypothetical protein [Rhodobiaceae bacterium]MCC0054877.1 hypothetical protein [Rhodobiaceae bacterium]